VSNNEEIITRCIYDELAKLKMSWGNLVFYGEFGVKSFMMEFYVKNTDGGYTKCFDLPGIKSSAFDIAFMNIYRQVNKIRHDLPDSQRWTNFTLNLSSNGKFKIDYDYTDLTECAYEYHKKWGKKYLGL